MKVRKYTIISVADFGFYEIEEIFTPEKFDAIMQGKENIDNVKVEQDDTNEYTLWIKIDGCDYEYNVIVEEFIPLKYEEIYENKIENDEMVDGLKGYVYYIFEK